MLPHLQIDTKQDRADLKASIAMGALLIVVGWPALRRGGRGGAPAGRGGGGSAPAAGGASG
jgi:hypothetical protein